jgi:DUF4097 and DUF4098 domain-containing protein YvlB
MFMQTTVLVRLASIAAFAWLAAVPIGAAQTREFIEVANARDPGGIVPSADPVPEPQESAPAIAPVRNLPRVEGQERVERRQRRQRREGSEFTERFSRKVPLGQSGQFEISNITGDIQITAGGSNDVAIEAVKRAYGASESEAAEQLSSVEVDVTEGGGRVEVRTEYLREQQRSNRVSVDYNVIVPAGAQVVAKSVSGGVVVKAIRGDLHAESVSGDVFVDAASRMAIVKSVSGEVQIVSAGSDGELKASSVSGALSARNVKAKVLELGTVSGRVTLTDMSCSRANIRSVSGALQYTGTLTRGGRYEMKSHSGDIQLAVPDSVGFEVTATSYSGVVQSDLPMTLRGGAEPSQIRTGTGRERHGLRTMRGQYGDGGAYVELTTFSGDIAISKR